MMLRRWAAGGRVAHAYLFTGAPGMGKREAALELAKILNCERLPAGPPPSGPCGECAACAKIDLGVHPEVRVVAADGVTTRIGQVREVCREVHLRPALGSRRVYIFENADRLTAEAANALLAVLEEPPAHAVLVLLAVHPQALLPTVVSRCHALPFRPWPEEILAARLERETGAAPGAARLAAVLSQGNPGLARRLLAEGEQLAGRDRAEQVLHRLLSCGEVTNAHSLAADLEAYTRDRAGTLAFLDMLTVYLRDLLVCGVSGTRRLLVNQDRAAWIEAHARERSADQFLEALGAVAFVREAVRQNGQRRTCLDLLVRRLAAGGGGAGFAEGSRGQIPSRR